MLEVEILLFWSQGFHNSPRNAHTRRPRWNRFDHHRARADPCTIPNCNGSQNSGVGSNNDTVSQSGMAFLFFKGRTAHHNAFINETIVTDLGCLSNYDAHSVIDEEPPSKLCPWMNLDSRKQAIKV